MLDTSLDVNVERIHALTGNTGPMEEALVHLRGHEDVDVLLAMCVGRATFAG